MKKVFFSLIFTSFFLLPFFGAMGQTSAKKEMLLNKKDIKFSPKFIDNVELVPEGSIALQHTEVEENIVEKHPTIDVNTSFCTIEKCIPIQFKYAIITKRAVEELANTSLYNFIDSWIGTRYRYGGRDKKGIDCSFFTATLLKQIFDIQLPRCAKEQYNICAKLNKDDLKEGDLVFFNIRRRGVSHVGVYLGNNYFIHSSSSRGVMISNLEENYFSKRFVSGGRPL